MKSETTQSGSQTLQDTIDNQHAIRKLREAEAVARSHRNETTYKEPPAAAFKRVRVEHNSRNNPTGWGY